MTTQKTLPRRTREASLDLSDPGNPGIASPTPGPRLRPQAAVEVPPIEALPFLDHAPAAERPSPPVQPGGPKSSAAPPSPAQSTISTDSMEKVEPAAVAAEGLDRCRRGDWEGGIRFLAYAVETGVEDHPARPLIYSFLGYGIALQQSRYREALKLCQNAVRLSRFNEAEPILNLARVYSLAGREDEAMKTIIRGLRNDPSHLGLRRLRRELSTRRAPVFPSLRRKHPLNELSGRLRHVFFQRLEGLQRAWERLRLRTGGRPIQGLAKRAVSSARSLTQQSR